MVCENGAYYMKIEIDRKKFLLAAEIDSRSQ